MAQKQEQFYPQQSYSNLLPLRTALGVSPEHVSSQPEMLVLREKWSWGGDSFAVNTAYGREVIRMRASAISFTSRKGTFSLFLLLPPPLTSSEFLHPNGNLLYTLRNRLFSIPRSFYLEDATGSEFLTIEGGWSFGTKLEVAFLNMLDPAGPQPVKLQVRGDWIARKADITWDGVPVARVQRQFANWREVSGRHTYGVEIAPGVDLALIAALVVAVDEDRRGGRG